jgi:hypothetical protein
MLWTLSMSVRPVLAKASELSPVKNESSYHVASKCFISREFGNGLVIGLGFELQVWEFLICLFVWHQVNTRAFHTLS